MKQPAARLYQYHLADDAPEGVTSRFCTLLRLCPNVYKLPSVSVRVQAGSPASPHRSVCTTQKLDVSRCCFVFMGRLSYKSPLQKLSPRSLLSLRLFVVYPGFFFHFLYHGKDSAFHFIMCEEFVFMRTLALCWKDLHATNWLG